jgi:hypothetical protein
VAKLRSPVRGWLKTAKELASSAQEIQRSITRHRFGLKLRLQVKTKSKRVVMIAEARH